MGIINKADSLKVVYIIQGVMPLLTLDSAESSDCSAGGFFRERYSTIVNIYC